MERGEILRHTVPLLADHRCSSSAELGKKAGSSRFRSLLYIKMGMVDRSQSQRVTDVALDSMAKHAGYCVVSLYILYTNNCCLAYISRLPEYLIY